MKVGALLAEELATATASFDCRQATLEDEQIVQREYEAEFVAEFDSELEEIFSG